MMSADLSCLGHIGDLSADLFDFGVEELDKLFDRELGVHGLSKGTFGDVLGVSVYENFGRQVVLAVSPNHGLVANPSLGKALIVMDTRTALALAAMLKVAAKKSLEH